MLVSFPMLARSSSLLVVFAAGALLFTGCEGGSGGGSARETASEAPATTASGLKKVSADKLPGLGDYLPDLDEGRVSIAPPKDWNVLGRNKNYLAAFAKKPGDAVPFISVAVSEPVVGGIQEVTEENAEEFAEKLQAFLEGKYGDKLDKNVLEPVKAMMIGDTLYARYVKNARKSDTALNVQVLNTIQGGRMYAIELQVNPGKVKDDRDAAYAVAAGLQFKSAGKKSDTTKADAAKADEPEKKD